MERVVESRRVWDGHRVQFQIVWHEVRNTTNAITPVEILHEWDLDPYDRG